jgi:hypothetical protein
LTLTPSNADHDDLLFPASVSGVPHSEFEKMLINSATAASSSS